MKDVKHTNIIDKSDGNSFAYSLLSKQCQEFNFEEAVEKWTAFFRYRQLKYSQHRACFSVFKIAAEDYATYGALVIKHCERFEFDKWT